MSFLEVLAEIKRTDVTNTIHREPYPAILPTRAELSQAGKAVLVTGGGTGVGFAIARAFVHASAATVIIIGRRANVLETARVRLEQEVETTGSDAKIIAQTCDVVNFLEVDAFWEGLKKRGVTVDVYVANAAKFTEVKPLLELGSQEVWSQVEANVKSPLYFTEKFHAQAREKQTVSLTWGVLSWTVQSG